MRMLEEFFPEFTEKLDEIDQLYAEKRMIDEKTYIGIRKVMGANISNIMKLISKDYIIPIIISAIISIPASWYFINKWLQNFSYRINIQWFVFVIAPALAFIIALIAINMKAYFAALKNPVNAIRYE